MGSELDTRIRKLEKELWVLKVYAVTLTVVLGFFSFLFATGNAVQADRPGDRVLRARGLIIEDEAGKERILLGAPVPAARGRLRTDPSRVEKIWAKRFPDPKEYMRWYKEFVHSMNGLVILDEQGFDRLALGSPVPDLAMGKRLAPATGLVINDEQGLERSGYGLLKVDGRYRAVLGMDSAKGSEGLTLSLIDDGAVGVAVQDGKRLAYLGSTPSKDKITGIAGPFHGLHVRGADGIKFMANAATQAASVEQKP